MPESFHAKCKRLGLYDKTLEQLVDKIDILDTAVRRAIADSESGNGWGPDVTVCDYLRDALEA